MCEIMDGGEEESILVKYIGKVDEQGERERPIVSENRDTGIWIWAYLRIGDREGKRGMVILQIEKWSGDRGICMFEPIFGFFWGQYSWSGDRRLLGDLRN